jgi:hypothetical protein
VLEVNDRIVEVNGISVLGLGVREVAQCVRRRKQDRILSLVVRLIIMIMMIMIIPFSPPLFCVIYTPA